MPALVTRASLGQGLRKVKPESAFTTAVMFLMPGLLRPEGIDAETITFPSLVQRMQAVASGSVDGGNGGLGGPDRRAGGSAAGGRGGRRGAPAKAAAGGFWRPAAKPMAGLPALLVRLFGGTVGP